MSASLPSFTIVMPTRNHARWIETAVRSVLEQDYAGTVELVVRDALSDDATPEILRRYADRLTWIRERDDGQVDAINHGLARATGDVVAWLNSDDLYLPGALAQVAAAFAADPELDFVYGDVLEIDGSGRILTPNPFTEDCAADRYLHSHNFMCQPTVFLRRRVIDQVGLLREDLRWFMDYEWFARFHRAGLRGQRLRHFLAANRDHPETKTNSGGIARWWEAMRVFARNPGPILLTRPSTWIYTLEYVIKGLNAIGWSAPPDKPVAKRTPQERTVDYLNRALLAIVRPRSFDDIIRRYGEIIAPHGSRVEDLWRAARPARLEPPAPSAPASPAMIEPLAPELFRAYPNLVSQMHDALREWLFPQLPLVEGRIDLMAKLLGTGIPEAMYVLAALHEGLADPGDVCEFGVAQGATSALLANELRGTTRTLWLFDSFQGLPKPSDRDQLKDDIFNLGSIERYEGEMRCDAREVEHRLREIAYPTERYRIRPGWIHETLRADAPASVCFAYVDFDFYEPIRDTLEYLDRCLSPRGRVVVDDYDWFSTGAKSAVDEFMAARGAAWEMTRPPAWAGAFCVLRRRS